MSTFPERVKAWVLNNKQLAGIGAACLALFIVAIRFTGQQGERHMRHITDLVHKYDAQSCEKLIAEKTLAETEALAAKDAQISELTAKSVHLEQVEKRLNDRNTEMQKQLTAAQNAATSHKDEARRMAAQLKEALALQTELMDRLKSNEEAYNQAQNLEKLFKTVKMEYDATVPIVKEFQQKAAAAAYGQ